MQIIFYMHSLNKYLQVLSIYWKCSYVPININVKKKSVHYFFLFNVKKPQSFFLCRV